MKSLLSLLFVSILLSVSAQEDTMDVFDNLIGTWVSEGKQLGGHEGKTVKEITYGLDGEIVKVKTFTTDPKTLEFGLRNEGVRTRNAQTGTIEFYEFDKFGGVTKGQVIIEGKDLHYQYAYGEMVLRDSWTFVDENTYDYTVTSVKNDDPDQVYHQGRFVKQ